ncbi:hypothetical protein I6N90_02615 [Paenibacillus sp. GSMTC-2017]|uniref:phage baseplate plug family protein n=1 Tax=Paenibacillus sp. GSMTC-2017 TaxID=2794350 RepID=UPI0018D77065|nr:hypothetical protein [Paenibacillus sp. GSMTC-2017]MBH5316701.1 hypothetical protein [Paenibacillus sp. GSMTC-2017]
MRYIAIEKNLVPYRFDMGIDNELFTFEIHYNSEFDFFTVDLERNGETLVVGEKMVYGVQLFGDVLDNRFPKTAIIPYDESGNAQEVTWNTLSDSVFLFLYEGADDA